MPADLLSSEPNLLSLSDADLDRRRRSVGLESDDITRILSVQNLVMQRLDHYVTCFLEHLAKFKEAATLTGRLDVADETRRLKRQHLVALAAGHYSSHYVEERIRLGLHYSKHGLETRVFLGAFHQLMRAIGNDVMEHFAGEPMVGFETFTSLTKVAFFDISIIVDVLVAERERMIAVQQEALRELSTPVLRLREHLLILPIIGVIDTQRAKQLTDHLLHAIRANRARMVVMDITGVAVVDSKVANHLLQTVTAARLMGATVVVTGLSASVAQSLVALGVDLGKIATVGDLQGGLEEAERRLGYRVFRANET
jgi:rsbT co-antagonist protein RsbR